MKRVCILIVAVIAIGLTGCAAGRHVSIDAKDWRMATVQSGEKGEVVACTSGYGDVYTDAEILELTCWAADGGLVLHDLTNDRSYTGAYSRNKTSSEDTMYDITIGKTIGYAITGLTTFQDGTQAATFIIQIGAYTLNFVAGK